MSSQGQRCESGADLNFVQHLVMCHRLWVPTLQWMPSVALLLATNPILTKTLNLHKFPLDMISRVRPESEKRSKGNLC